MSAAGLSNPVPEEFVGDGIMNLDQLNGVTAIGGPGVDDNTDRGNAIGFMSVIDMDHSPDEWVNSPEGGPAECTPEAALYMTIDLGTPCLITGVTIWHYYGNARAYCAQKIALSTTGDFVGEETVVYDTGSDYGPPESSSGNAFVFPAMVTRFVRHWSAGSTSNPYVHFLEIDVYGARALF